MSTCSWAAWPSLHLYVHMRPAMQTGSQMTSGNLHTASGRRAGAQAHVVPVRVPRNA